MRFQGAAGGGCLKPASGSVVPHSRGVNKHCNESKLPRKSDFSLSHFYFLYLYEQRISGRGSLWWSGGVCVYACSRAIFSSEGRLTSLEWWGWDYQFISLTSVSFRENGSTAYRYIRRQQSTMNFVKDFIRQQSSKPPSANSWSMCISVARVTGTRWSLETFTFTQDLKKWNI